MPTLDATTEFAEASLEITVLIDYARRNKKEIHKYQAFNKAALVLLCAKFEAFLEAFLAEYCYAHMELSSNKNLDENIYDHLVSHLLEVLEPTKNNKRKRKEAIDNLALLCGDVEIKPCTGFEVNARFKYGKHGEKEVVRLLDTFGLKSVLDDACLTDFFRKFNSLNSIRNNIIHEDATPSLTHQDTEEFLENIQTFVSCIDNVAQIRIASIAT